MYLPTDCVELTDPARAVVVSNFPAVAAVKIVPGPEVIVAVIESPVIAFLRPSRYVTTIDAVDESPATYVDTFVGAVVASAVAVHVSPATR